MWRPEYNTVCHFLEGTVSLLFFCGFLLLFWWFFIIYLFRNRDLIRLDWLASKPQGL